MDSNLQYILTWIARGSIGAVIVVLVIIVIQFWYANRSAKRGKILVHVPAVWTLSSLFRSVNSVAMSRDGKTYVPARPWAHIGGFGHRCRCAWLAFTGRCDLVRWPEGQ